MTELVLALPKAGVKREIHGPKREGRQGGKPRSILVSGFCDSVTQGCVNLAGVSAQTQKGRKQDEASAFWLYPTPLHKPNQKAKQSRNSSLGDA